MNRGAWRATVTGSQRAGHDWATSLNLKFNGFQKSYVSLKDRTERKEKLKLPVGQRKLTLDLRKRWGFPQWLSGKESTCWCRKHRFDPWSGKIPQAAGQRRPCTQVLSLCSSPGAPTMGHNYGLPSVQSLWAYKRSHQNKPTHHN